MSSLLDLPGENALLRERLRETEAVLAAVRMGAVDALVGAAPGKVQVFTLDGAERPYRAFVEAMHEGAATIDTGGCVLYSNEALARLLGRPLRSVIGTSAREMVVPEHREAFEELMRSGTPAGAQRQVELLAADGSSVPVLVTGAPMGGGSGKVALVISDLREHERGAATRGLLEQSERSRRALLSLLEDQAQTELNLRRVNRALKTLSAGNEALVRATDEASLLREMTRILHEVGGYPIVLIGYAADDERKTIEMRACAGMEPTDALTLDVSWGDNERGQTSIARAFRSGQTVTVRNTVNDPGYAPWHGLLQSRGLNAALGLPLRSGPGQPPFGVIGIAASGDKAFDTEEVKLLEELAGDLAYGIVNLRAGIEQRAAGEKLRRSLEGTIAAIGATMESRDPYTAGHQHRVADLAGAIAREMGLPPHTIEGIHFGALIHDLGKIQVPAELLSKPTRLSRIELELIRTHPETGYDIVKGIEFPWPLALMVLQHHERLDGTGYPQGLKGEAIALEARVLAVADVVEAMSSHRPYRPGLGLEAALTHIEEKKGTWFEPAAVDACLRLFHEKRFTFEK